MPAAQAPDLPLAKKLLFSLLPALVLFAGLEIALRALGLPEEKELIERFEFPPPGPVNRGFEDDPDLFWRLRADFDAPWTYWRLAYTHEGRVDPLVLNARKGSLPDPGYRSRVSWQVNREGYRGPPAEASSNVLLLVGSSITFGWAVRWEDSFAGRLAAKLADAGLEDWAVIDAGVPGYSSYQTTLALRRWLERARVRAVVYEAGVNDGTFAPVRSDRDLALLGRPRHENRIWSRSHLFLWLHFAVRDWLAPSATAAGPAQEPFYASRLHEPGRSRVSREDFLLNLEAARSLAESQAIEIYFLIPALYNEHGDERLEKSVRVSLADEIPLVEALAALPPRELARQFLPYDEAHFSRRGHAFVAGLIWDRLRRDGVLPPAAGAP
jgi:hypothetical protein